MITEVRTALIFMFLAGAPLSALAAEIPSSLRGIWSTAPNCKASEFGQSDGAIRIKARAFDYHEGSCKLTKISRTSKPNSTG
jgi:hypothetical protein